MSPLRIGVIGGGSIFVPELVDLLGRYSNVLGPIDLRLMDVDADRMAIVGGLCERIVARAGTPIAISYHVAYEPAIEGADFVLVQFRVGGEDARIGDDRLGLEYRIPFVETVTVCGFAAFLRSFYEIEKIAGLAAELAPDAWVMEFANPSGMLAEALSRLGRQRVVGVCNSSIVVRDGFAEALGGSPDELEMAWRGLNHLTVVDSVRWRGREVYPELVDRLAETPHHYLPFPPAFIREVGFIPSYYLRYHWFAREMVEELQARPTTRGEDVKRVNAGLLDQYRTADEVPDELRQRGGYGYSRAVANAIRGLVTGDRSVHYLSVPNRGSIPELPRDAFVEIPVEAVDGELRALEVPPLPPVARELLVTMKAYETTLIEAARARDRRGLLQALLIHPLIGDAGIAEPLLADVLEQNGSFLPRDIVRSG
jgi:6-phospho-beta-glucosidase